MGLNYLYFGGQFVETAGQNLYGNDKIRISISATSAEGTTPENQNGGFLTQYLVFLLENYKYLSLWLIDGERKIKTKNSFEIKTNMIINDKTPFIKLNE